MELFKAITEARSAAMVVEKICHDNGISIDLTSLEGFGPQGGKLTELLGVEVWISLKIIQEANPWPGRSKTTEYNSGFNPNETLPSQIDPLDGSLSDQIYAYQRFRRACLTMVSIFDFVPSKLFLTRPQPTEEVVENFVGRVLHMSVDNGPFRLLENGSIVHSVPRGTTLKSPLFLRPRVTFQSFSTDSGVLLPDMETANSLRERMREIMIEAEERDNRRRKPKLKL
jgi:hypothetical protein